MTLSWMPQLRAVARVETLKYLRARRWIAPVVLAILPNAVMLAALVFGIREGQFANEVRRVPFEYARWFQYFWQPYIIFFSCLAIFGQLLRSEFLEKTLHHYYLAPIRREIVVLGKFLTALAFLLPLFIAATASSYFLFFWPSTTGRDFLLSAIGISHMFRYVGMAAIACTAYGALFLMIGLTFRNPVIPALFVLCWESFNFVMPSLFQHLSVTLYLRSFMPVTVLSGPYGITVEPPSPVLSAAGLLLASGCVVALCCYLLRHVSISYGAE